MEKLKGTGVAMVTPFKEDGSICFDSLTRLTEHLINGGVNYLVVMGTTGESVTLSAEEKTSVLRHIQKVNAGRLPIVLGVGGNNTASVTAQLKALNTDGIDAILSVSPAYNKPTQEGIYHHYKAVSEASPLPIVLYNVPGRTGSNMSAETTLRLARDFDNIVAIKEASGSLDQCTAILKDRPEGFMVISGDDTLSLPIIASGGDGVISVVANPFPKAYSELISASLNSDLQAARKRQYQLFDIINMLFAEGNPAGAKCVLKQLGVISSEHVRLPLVPVSEKLRAEFSEKIARL